MRRRLGWLAAAALTACAVAVRPSLVPAVAIGVGIGAVAAVLLVYRSKLGAAVRSVRRWAIVGLLLLMVAAMGALTLSGGSEMRRQPSPDVEEETHRLPSVLAVDYEALFELEGSDWDATEFVRLERGVLERNLPPAISEHPRRLLGGRWRYRGTRGSSGQILLYRRQRTLPIETRSWPPVAEDTIPVGAIASDALPTVLVGRNGSQVEIRAPENVVREIDSPATKRRFGGNDVFVVRLADLEDNPDRRALRLRIASGIGRSSVYAALESVTAWTLVRLLFASVPALLVGFALTRLLNRRFPERQPACAG
jgi:hypothetical protein